MIASSYTLAAFFSTPIVMLIGLKTGRRKLLLLGNVLVIIGAAVQASAYSMGHIIVGRVICGFGIGFVSSACNSVLHTAYRDSTNLSIHFVDLLHRSAVPE